MDPMEALLRLISERSKSRTKEKAQSTQYADPAYEANRPSSKSADLLPAIQSINSLDPAGADQLKPADIAIVVALHDPELHQVLDAFSPSWTKEGREGVIYNVAHIRLDQSDVTVVAAAQNTMGMVPATILTTKTIRAWQPKLLVMAGICAGVQEKVSLGDVIVARQVFDYGSGKLKNGILIPDYEPVTMDDELCNHVSDFSKDKAVLRGIKDAWPVATGVPQTELRAHVGAFASGAAVVSDEPTVKGIREHKRSLLGLDMEAYGVARATVSAKAPLAPFLIVKGVQDFATEAKSDEVREYAAYASARFLFCFLDAHWKIIDRRAESIKSGRAF
ncbi:MAG: hypothetical protein KIS62_08595 [Ramlibacter sp.]|nr:hypothetical protein [Ramlibacter sp.]